PVIFLCTTPARPAPYPLSLHDALPICTRPTRRWRRTKRSPASTHDASGSENSSARHFRRRRSLARSARSQFPFGGERASEQASRSEEHTSELQSRGHLVCRLLLEKKKQ